MKAHADLLDKIKLEFNVKNDAALSRLLDTMPPIISKIRNEKLAISAQLIIAIHETTGWSIRGIKAELNMPCLTQKIHTVQ